MQLLRVMAAWGLWRGGCGESRCGVGGGLRVRAGWAGVRQMLQASSRAATLLDDENEREHKLSGKERAYRKGSYRPHGFWSSRDNRRAFLDEVAAKFGVTGPHEWHKVRVRDIRAAGGRGLLGRYSFSLHRALEDLYPEVEWDNPAFLTRAPRNFWDLQTNRTKFFDRLAKKKGVTTAGDWWKVTLKEIKQAGGEALLAKYDFDLTRCLQSAYPDIVFRDEMCRAKRKGAYWDSPANRRLFMEGVMREHGVTKPSDWALIRRKDILEMGGSGLLRRFFSVFDAVRDTFPEITWDQLTARPVVPSSYWQDDDNVCDFIKKVATVYKVREKEDWYRISMWQLTQLKGSGLLRAMSLGEALAIAYPDERWDADKFASCSKRSTQRALLLTVEKIFPGTPVLEEYSMAVFRP